MSTRVHGEERLPAAAADATARAFAVTAPFDPARAARELGGDAYVYADLYRAFRPLLERLGSVIEVDRPESRLDYTLQQTRARGVAVTHLSFLPLQHVYLSSMAANVAVLGWGLVDLQNADLGNDARNNWVRIADHLSTIVCASECTRAAFVRAGVRSPLRVVPVPVADAFFSVPRRLPDDRGRLDGPVYIFPGPGAARAAPDPWDGPTPPPVSAAVWAGRLYARVQPRTPAWIRRGLRAAVHAARASYLEYRGVPTPPPSAASATLAGVVYTSVLDPADRRSNWQDLLSAFLIALCQAEDAVLIVTLLAPSACPEAGLLELLDYYHGLDLDHRCTLVVVAQPPSEPQLLELARCSTYALSASRAEGTCLPIQQLLAAGRPAVAPQHSALGECVDAEVGFPVASHPEPTQWPRDPTRRLTTTWHRIVWQSLHDQIQASYRIATAQREVYERIAGRARERMRDRVSGERVWPRLRDALAIDDARAAVR